MVLSVQTKLLRSIDEHLASSIELWNILSKRSAKELSDSQQFCATLVPILQEQGLLCQRLSKKLLFAEHAVEAPHTLLIYQRQALAQPAGQKLTVVAALLAALAAYKNVLGHIPVNIQWLFGEHEPEMNLGELKVLQPDACVCYYAAETGSGNSEMPALAYATKGRLCVELEVHVGNGAIDSMHAGVAPDALWRLLWALGTLKDAREDILIEGFYDSLASVQDDAMAQLRALPDNASELTQSWGLQQPLMGLHGFQFHYAHILLPTCTVNSIKSEPINAGDVLSRQATAQVSFYLVPDQDPQDIFNKLQLHLRRLNFSDIQVRILLSTSPLSTPVSNSFIQLAISATEKAYEQTPYILPTTVGSYAIPALWMKDGMPTVFIAEHGLAEDNITFVRMIKQIALLLEGMAHGTDTTE